MSLEARLESLERKHKHQHSLIEAAEAEKAPEQFVYKMKADKLKLKDEIESIKRDLSI